jgi:hypothetical protein
MSHHNNTGLCIVAGNSSYLTEQERTVDPVSRVAELVRVGRNQLRSAPIFVGSEGLRDLVPELTLRYSAIPFMLLGPSVDQTSRMVADNCGTAVYCPCKLSNGDNEELIKSFGYYALRRRWVRETLRSKGFRVSEVRAKISNGGTLQAGAEQILGNAIQNLALFGKWRTHTRLHELSRSGISYVACLPADEDAEQNEHLSELAEQFRGGCEGGLQAS